MRFWNLFANPGADIMESKNRQRDYLFDNYKVLLIILVIIGHFTEPSYRNNDFLYTLKWLIVSFHMPAFIFISGYFSKRELTFAKLFQKLVIPYLIYEFVYYFFGCKKLAEKIDSLRQKSLIETLFN